MDKNPEKFGIALALAALLLTCLVGPVEAGTRMIPPPPPRHLNDEVAETESAWGQEPAKPYQNEEDRMSASERRFSALQDDEGREVNFRRQPASTGASRAPAGLQVHGHGTSRNEEQRPTVKMNENTEKSRQADQVERVVNDLADPVERRKGVQEVAIIAGDLGFFPKTIFVSRDVPVRLFVTGASKQNLCLMMDTFNVRKQVRSTKIEEITFVPNQPGTYRFYCPINNGEGTLVVKELTTVADTE